MSSTAILLGISLLFCGNVEDERELEATWRREYPKAAKLWEHQLGNFSAKGNYYFHYNDKTEFRFDRIQFARLDQSRLCILDQKQNIGNQSSPDQPGISCRTPTYKFGILTQNGRSLLRYYEANTQPTEDDTFDSLFSFCASGATTYYRYSLLDRMTDPSFELKSISTVSNGGEDLIHIHFAFTGEYVIEDGQVDLAPSKNWGIIQISSEFTSKKTRKIQIFKKQISYQKTGDQQFFPLHLESREHRLNRPDVYESEIVNIDSIQLDAATPEIFRLSTYGIPDLPLKAQPRTSVFTWKNPMLWIASISSCLCFLIVRFLRSRQSPTS